MDEIECPHCHKKWSKLSEQAVAIEKRGKCIACLAQAGESFSVDPYEFTLPPSTKPKDGG